LLLPARTDRIDPSSWGESRGGKWRNLNPGNLIGSRQLRIAKLVDRGYYADGGGLYFQISGSGSRSWIYQFNYSGVRARWGLGR
jgi:hypothetical protein